MNHVLNSIFWHWRHLVLYYISDYHFGSENDKDLHKFLFVDRFKLLWLYW